MASGAPDPGKCHHWQTEGFQALAKLWSSSRRKTSPAGWVNKSKTSELGRGSAHTGNLQETTAAEGGDPISQRGEGSAESSNMVK